MIDKFIYIGLRGLLGTPCVDETPLILLIYTIFYS